MNILKIITISSLILLTSCSFFTSDDSVYSRSKIINNNAAIAGWNKINETKNADLAFENKKSHSLIVLNSNCRKNQFSTLDSLIAGILSGIEEVKITENIKDTIYQREAAILKASGKIDGVKRYLSLIVFQKDFCIYDSMLISNSEKNLNNEFNTFVNFVKSSLKDASHNE